MRRASCDERDDDVCGLTASNGLTGETGDYDDDDEGRALRPVARSRRRPPVPRVHGSLLLFRPREAASLPFRDDDFLR